MLNKIKEVDGMKKHNYFNKIMSVITAVAITLPMCMLTVSASAYTVPEECPNCISFNTHFYRANNELCDTLANGMKKLETEIDIERFNASVDKVKSAMRVASEMHPELFYISKTTFGIIMGANAVKVIPKYTYKTDKIPDMQEQLGEKTDYILSKITPDMSNFQKTMIIHDEIVLGCEYSNTVDSQYLRTSVYDCLVNGYANCQGYASSMSYLLEQVGIKSEIVESSQMNHVWNLVEIDDKYYNLDATFDDPTPNKFSFVSHKYFLLSDVAIKTYPNISIHYGYNAYHSASSKIYDDSYFKTINTKLCYSNGYFYAADNNHDSENAKKLVKLDSSGNFIMAVAKISDKWYAPGGYRYWQDGFISTDELNGDIYFNLNDSICKFTVATGQVHIVSDDINVSDYNYIYGMHISQDGRFFVNLVNAPTADPNIKEVKILPESKHERLNISLVGNDILIPKFTLGDVNSDGDLSVVDVTLLQMICSGSLEPTEVQTLAADYNSDGKVDINDATALQIHLTSEN